MPVTISMHACERSLLSKLKPFIKTHSIAEKTRSCCVGPLLQWDTRSRYTRLPALNERLQLCTLYDACTLDVEARLLFLAVLFVELF